MDLFSYFLSKRASGGSNENTTSDNSLALFIERKNIDDSFVIPNAVTAIGAGAFCNCDFVDFIIPAQVKSTADMSFYNCRKMVSVTLCNIKTIGSAAFSYCTALQKVFLASDAVPVLEKVNAFSSNADDRIFIVPNSEELKTAYCSATNWSTFADMIYTANEALADELITQEEYDKFLEVVG